MKTTGHTSGNLPPGVSINEVPGVCEEQDKEEEEDKEYEYYDRYYEKT
mgnify:CR=1 FL=1